MRWMAVTLMMVGGCAHQEAKRAVAPAPVREYRVQAQELELHNPDPMHHDAVRAMRKLSEAVRALPTDANDLARDIDAQADAIERSPETANHSGPARRALDDALQAMGQVPRPHPLLPAKLEAARKSVDQIDPAVPYLQEKAVIDDAFSNVANAMVLATLPTRARAVPADWRVQRLNRYLFDQLGPNPDPAPVCGAAGASAVQLKRRADDLALGVLTLGFYTPVHAKVICRNAG